MFSIGDQVIIVWDQTSAPELWRADDIGRIVAIEGSETDPAGYEIEFDRNVGGHAGSASDTPDEADADGRRWCIHQSEPRPLLEDGQRYPIGRQVEVNCTHLQYDWPRNVQGRETVKIIDYVAEHGYLVQFRDGIVGHNGHGYPRVNVRGNHCWWVAEPAIVPPQPEVGDRVKFIGDSDWIPEDARGKVLIISNEGARIGVEFDRSYPACHSCGDRGHPGRCLWLPAREVEIDFTRMTIRGGRGRVPQRRREPARIRPLYQPGDRVSIPFHVGQEVLPDDFRDEDEATVVESENFASILIRFDRNNGAGGTDGRHWSIHQENLQFVDQEVARSRQQESTKTVRCPRLREMRGLPALSERV